MIISDNVLTPEIFHKLRVIVDAIKDITIIGENGEEMDLEQLCLK
jgi:hypothetical protein